MNKSQYGVFKRISRNKSCNVKLPNRIRFQNQLKCIPRLLSLVALSFTLVSPATVASSYHGSNHHYCPLQKIGYLKNLSFWDPSTEFLNELMTYFPVKVFEDVTLDPNLTIFRGASIDTQVDEMERIVNEMKTKGIRKIIFAAFSSDTGPWIEGSVTDDQGVTRCVGNLNCVHADIRHPNVVFAAVNQGTQSVDNANNWLRPGADLKTDATVGPLANLPDASGNATFILATDDSTAVRDVLDQPYKDRAVVAGYDLQTIVLGWDTPNAATFNNMQALDDAIAAAAADANRQVIVGISMTTAVDMGLERFRHIDFTNQAKSGNFPNIFNPNLSNVSYLSIGYIPGEVGTDSQGTVVNEDATINVDLNYGAISVSEFTGDPKGVNKFLLKLGFPDERIAAEQYNSPGADRDGDGEADGLAGARFLYSTLAFFSTCGKRNLDSRYLIDEDGHRAEFYIEDNLQLSGTVVDDRVKVNLRVNPRWCESLAQDPPFTKTKGFKKYCQDNDDGQVGEIKQCIRDKKAQCTAKYSHYCQYASHAKKNICKKYLRKICHIKSAHRCKYW